MVWTVNWCHVRPENTPHTNFWHCYSRYMVVPGKTLVTDCHYQQWQPSTIIKTAYLVLVLLYYCRTTNSVATQGLDSRGRVLNYTHKSSMHYNTVQFIWSALCGYLLGSFYFLASIELYNIRLIVCTESVASVVNSTLTYLWN